MSANSQTNHIALGLGERVQIRRPTDAERSVHGWGTGELVVEYRHTDRPPDVLLARDATIEPRSYGVCLPDRAVGDR